MADNFFKVEYREGLKGIIPVVWMGNQGFALDEKPGYEDMTPQKHAEWFASMFKMAIDNYAAHKVLKRAEQLEKQRTESSQPGTRQRLLVIVREMKTLAELIKSQNV